MKQFTATCEVFGLVPVKTNEIVPEYELGDISSYKTRPDANDMLHVTGVYQVKVKAPALKEALGAAQAAYKEAKFGELQDYYRNAFKIQEA